MDSEAIGTGQHTHSQKQQQGRNPEPGPRFTYKHTQKEENRSYQQYIFGTDNHKTICSIF